mmetsp:Transcript_20021/g.30308  ORF Transcript_20021/g.30308 Transcript_20021/m.30308 type:complete len:492 (-) Transcript_20021:324-1799(-)|eukprot:CAMPEP_0194114202 /NCGR_PEP_ID=MMETSP0150-20130528/19273_1 /TAXON_ID=122233 /ORGANISM="Chaetoceros debilis, Strain MM31A-1" /LENGTH=491 /DNA_ID=CAMNT_0038804333 /DNA_START=25 /DNA_END=1500 /DNA_ORIENTATION=+
METEQVEKGKGDDELKPCPIFGCKPKRILLQTNDASGFLFNAAGSGPIIMSNIFLSTSIIYLAKLSIGCDPSPDAEEECDGRAYGLKPASLISFIATVSGVMAAFLLPFIGAIIDFTPWRRGLGIMSCTLLIIIQAVQAFTVQATWFPMSILQAINGFLYMVVSMAQYAYLPELALVIETKTMSWYTSLFYMVQFGHQSLFLIVVIAAGKVFSWNDVTLAHFSQGFNVLVSGTYLALSWYYFGKRDARRSLEQGQNLCGAGFVQVFQTARGLAKHYPRTVGIFFLGAVFAECAINSFTTVAVTYMNEVLKMSGTEIGIVFLIVMVSTIPGSLFATWLTNLKNPQFCYRMNILTFMITIFGFLLLDGPDKKMLCYGLGVVWGFWLGWFYPTEKLIYSMIVPAGQESELSGFFLYCTQILSWLPNLIFTMMNEAGINLSWGGIHLNIYLLIALIINQRMLPWDECISIARQENKIIKNRQSVLNAKNEEFDAE